MSRRADDRYSEPEWESFRDSVDAWMTIGGRSSLAKQFKISEATVEKWRLGVTTPSEATRQAVIQWMTDRVNGTDST